MASLQLLLVDDNATDLQLMEAAFEACPQAELILHNHAPTALHWVEAQAQVDALPNLVLLDLHMPGMNGPAWLRALRAQPALQQLPVLLYSLTPLHLQRQWVDPTFVYGYWQKPLTFAGMQDQAQVLCDLWQRDHAFTPTTLMAASSMF
jgi:CheY-like chemotaxis protein